MASRSSSLIQIPQPLPVPHSLRYMQITPYNINFQNDQSMDYVHQETGKALCNSENVDGYHTNDGEQHLDDMPMFGQGDFANSSRSHNQIENEDSVDHHETGKQFHSESHSFQQYSRHSQGDGPLSRDYEDRMSTRITSNDEPKPNIIVNYLPQNLTDKEFFHLFAPYGPMESIKIMRDSQVTWFIQ